MKYTNILIIESTRDNLVPVFAFVKDISLIKDKKIQDAVKGAIDTGEPMFLELGYYFKSISPLKKDMLPLTVNHIVNNIF